MSEEGRIGGLTYSVDPTYQAVSAVVNLWSWDLEDLQWFYQMGALEELPRGCSPQQDEIRYIVRDSYKRLDYALLILANFPLPQRRVRGSYEIREWHRTVKPARDHPRNGDFRHTDERSSRNYEWYEYPKTAEERNRDLTPLEENEAEKEEITFECINDWRPCVRKIRQLATKQTVQLILKPATPSTTDPPRSPSPEGVNLTVQDQGVLPIWVAERERRQRADEPEPEGESDGEENVYLFDEFASGPES